MKQAIAAIVFSIMFMFTGIAQLKEEAQYIKKTQPEKYECIKKEAIEEWGNDHQMIVYEINNQCEAYAKFLLFYSDHKDNQTYKDIATAALIQWSDDEGERLCSADWQMVMYEINNQVEAVNSY